MRIVFMGSDEIACPVLDALRADKKTEIIAVVAQPDRPKGRRQRLAPCALKAHAQAVGLPVMTPEKIGGREPLEVLRAWRPELFVVAAYGQYIPSSVLAIPPRGSINFHPSLLPRYRGASPIQWAVANGDPETGVTILYVSRDLDAGDIILQENVPILPEDTSITLAVKLAALGGDMMRRAIEMIRTGNVKAVPQDESKATYVTKLTKEDGRLDWRRPAEELNNRIRGFQPWPICYAELPPGEGKMLRIYRATIEPGQGAPGEILNIAGAGPLVATGRDALRLRLVQPPGKKIMPGDAFLRGAHLAVADRMK